MALLRSAAADAPRTGDHRRGRTRLEDVLRRAEPALDAEDAALVRAVFASYAYVTDLVEDKNTSIRRLRQLFFGARTETTKAVVGRSPEARHRRRRQHGCCGNADGDGPGPDEPRAAARPAAARSRAQRRDAYHGAARIEVPHASLRPATRVPSAVRAPSTRSRRACWCGSPASRRWRRGLRAAETTVPPVRPGVHRAAAGEAGERKYDATAGSMIGLLKYGRGLPFNRLDGLQGHLDDAAAGLDPVGHRAGAAAASRRSSRN